jgi:hypothetical protein
LIEGLSQNEIREKAENAAACRNLFDWAEEEKALLRLYDGILPTARTAASR